MIKIYDGIPKNFKVMHWITDLQKVGVSLGLLFNPFNSQVGLRYKKGTKVKSIIWDKTAGESKKSINSFNRIIREFEIKEFSIPKELSAYN